MPILHLDGLPPRMSRGELLHLLINDGGIGRQHVGKIEVRGSAAAIEVPAGWQDRLARALEGFTFKGRSLRAWTSGGEAGSGIAGEHFGRLARLLELESAAEAKEVLERLRDQPTVDAERTGDCLLGLVVVEESSGLGGRCLLTLAKRNRSAALPWNRLEPGSPVLLSPTGGPSADGWRGVVCERGEQTLSVAFNEPPEDMSGPTYRLNLSADEASRQRQRAALERVRAATRDRLAELRDILLGAAAPEFEGEAPLVPLDSSLNSAQQEAVRFALAARDVAIVHGPPGTGKTTAVVELIRQAIRRGQRVLACAPSNLAVDNLLERLLSFGERAVRLGHPARVMPGLRAHTLDILADEHSDARHSRRLAKEAFALFRKAGKYTRAAPEPGARQQMRQEARALLADARALERQAVEQVLESATVLCATLTGLDPDVLGRRQFDLAIIDEAAQSTEPACWLPLLRCRRVVLAGDHCQLPPTILSHEASAQGLGISLMERLAELHGSSVMRRLDVQYRMHEAIMAHPSAHFYSGSLIAHESVRGHLLSDLPGVTANPLTTSAVQLIDTAGAGYDEQPEPDGASLLNPQEAELVCRKVRALLDAGVSADTVAVIAPYSAQVRLLRERLAIPGLEIDSVDGFQGREKEAVVLSMVRSNREGEVGFLADVRRMNVALTRARRKLLVIGDSATLCSHPFYQGLLDYFQAIDAYRSVWEEEVT
jgi:hypothetical protein